MNSKEFGKIVSISGMWGCRNFVTTPLEFMLFASSHYVNLMTAIMGQFKQVQGNQRVVDNSISLAISAIGENNINASVIFIATPSWAKLNEELYITGTNGYIHIINGKQLECHFNPSPTDKPRWQIMDEKITSYSSVTTTGSGGSQDLYQRGFVGEVEHFLQCVKENKQPLTNAQDNVLTMDAIDKIVEAVK